MSPDDRTTDRITDRIKQWHDAKAWNDFVAANSGTVCHLFQWKSIIEKAYGQRCIFLASENQSGLTGVLPLVHTRSPFWGDTLTSMPYLDYGGILSSSEQAELLLFDEAKRIAAELGLELNLRFREPPSLQIPFSRRRVTMLLQLADSIDAMWTQLPSARRNRIRKGQRNGLSGSWHGEEALEEFYGVFAANMRDLGSPVHGIGFMREILRRLPDNASILLIRHLGKAIGGAVCLTHADEISVPWASALRSSFHQCPNPVLYWEIMKFGIKHGLRTLDFGRSSFGDGTYEAKRQWGAELAPLHWFFDPQQDDTVSNSSKYRLMCRVWQRVPVAATRWIGPWIRKGISG